MCFNHVFYSDFPRLRTLLLIPQPHPTNLFFPHWSGRIIIMKCKTQCFWSELPATPEVSPRVTSTTRPETKQTKKEIYLKIPFLPLLIHSLLLMDRWALWHQLRDLPTGIKILTAWHPETTPPTPSAHSAKQQVGRMCGRTWLQSQPEAAGIPGAQAWEILGLTGHEFKEAFPIGAVLEFLVRAQVGAAEGRCRCGTVKV